MANALVATPWVETVDPETQIVGRETLLVQTLAAARQSDPLVNWRMADVTGQQLEPGTGRFRASSPNTTLWLGTFSAQALAVIDATANLRVLYDDESRLADRTLNNNQFNQIRNYLTTRLGWNTAQVDAVIGTSHGGRTVRQIAVALLAYMRLQ